MIRIDIPRVYMDYINDIYKGNYIYADSVRDCDVRDKILCLYKDIQEYNPSDNIIRLMIYRIIEQFCYPLNDKDTRNKYVNVNKLIADIDALFADEKLREKILNGEYKPQSKFYSILKDIMPYVNDIDLLMNEKKWYLVLKKYQELFALLNDETLSKYTGEDLEMEYKKRYNYVYNRVRDYKLRMKRKKYKSTGIEITDFPKYGNYSRVCTLFLKYFQTKLLQLDEKTGYFYRPINENVDFFKFGDIGLIAYHYDDLVDILIRYPGIRFSMKSWEFWALVSDESKEKHIIIDDSDLKSKINFTKNLITTPLGIMDVAFAHYVALNNGISGTGEIDILTWQALQAIGFPIDDTPVDLDAFVYNNLSYCRNPKYVDCYNMRNIADFPKLAQLRKLDPDSRRKHFKKLQASFKGRYGPVSSSNQLKKIR